MSSLCRSRPLIEVRSAKYEGRTTGRILKPALRNSAFALRIIVFSRRLLQWMAALATVCESAAAFDTTAAFDSANKLYEQGKYQEAAAGYESLLHSGRASAALYFNLGNAYFKSSQMGRAVAAYRYAESITPRDPDIRANLQFARNQVSGPTLSMPAWQRWLKRLSLNEWTYLGAITVWLLFGALIVGQCRPVLKPSLRKFSIVFGAIAVLANGCLLTFFLLDRSASTVVVIAPEATVRLGPLDESQTAFTVHDGAELQVLDRKDDWLQVTTDPRRVGWVRRDQVIAGPQA